MNLKILSFLSFEWPSKKLQTMAKSVARTAIEGNTFVHSIIAIKFYIWTRSLAHALLFSKYLVKRCKRSTNIWPAVSSSKSQNGQNSRAGRCRLLRFSTVNTLLRSRSQLKILIILLVMFGYSNFISTVRIQSFGE